MKQILSILLLIAWLSMSFTGKTQDSGDDICGTYLVESPVSDDVVKIRMYKASNGNYQGKYVWLSRPNNDDGTPRTDIKNPDPSKRNRTAFQLIALWDLQYMDGEWVLGKIYDPTTGKTYGIKGKRKPNSRDMSMRYYWKKPALGLNSTWKRVD